MPQRPENVLIGNDAVGFGEPLLIRLLDVPTRVEDAWGSKTRSWVVVVVMRLLCIR